MHQELFLILFFIFKIESSSKTSTKPTPPETPSPPSEELVEIDFRKMGGTMDLEREFDFSPVIWQ